MICWQRMREGNWVFELAKGASGAIKSTADLLPFLNQSFMKSRAWLGTLLK